MARCLASCSAPGAALIQPRHGAVPYRRFLISLSADDGRNRANAADRLNFKIIASPPPPPEHNGRREGEPAGAVSRLLVQKSRGLIRPAVKWRNLPAADYR
jgi:hypothetical protein